MSRTVSCLAIKILVALIAICAGPVIADEYPDFVHEQTLTVGIDAPAKVTLDSYGKIYVSQPALNRITVHNQYGSFISSFNNISLALAVGVHDQEMFVGTANTIEVYDLLTGVKKTEFDYYFQQVNDIEFTSSDEVYVADAGANQIKVFSISGDFLYAIGSYGHGDGQLDFPVSLAIDESAGKVFVGDQGNSRIVVFDLNGDYLYSFGQHTYQDPGTFEWVYEGTFSCIQGISCEGGVLYVVDSYQSNVQVLDYTGSCLGFVGLFGDESGEFKTPMDVICADNELVVTSLNSRKVEIFGRVATSTDETDGDNNLPMTFSLSQNYPNPFNPTTQIDFYLHQSGNVTLRIYNVLGQNVATLVNGHMQMGSHSVQWNAADDTGQPVASGVYFYRLSDGERSISRRMMLLK